MVGAGGFVIDDGKGLLIRRGSEPLPGQWSIPGGALELLETLKEGTARELLEETGLIEVCQRINPYSPPGSRDAQAQPRFHFVIADYLSEKKGGEAKAAGTLPTWHLLPKKI